MATVFEFRGLHTRTSEEEENGETRDKWWVCGGIDATGTRIVQGDSFVDVDPETVGQFVGYRDSEGEKVFEGDVFLTYHMPVKVFVKVAWDYEDCRWQLKFLNDAIYRPLESKHSWKIVGNIHETDNLVNIAKEMIEGEAG